MMKILYINDNSNVQNGSSNALINMVKGLDRSKFAPFVSLPHDGPLRTELEKLDVSSYVGNWHYLWFPSKKAYCKHLGAMKERIAALSAIITTNQINLVHCNSIFALEGLVSASLCGCPSLLHVHVPLTSKHPLSEYFRLSPESLGIAISALTDKAVTVSEEMRQGLKPYMSPDLIQVLYNGIDTAAYSEATVPENGGIRMELGISSNAPLICSIGRIIERKGFDDFVDAAAHVRAKVPAASFILVGPEEDRKLAAELKDRVHNHGLDNCFYFLGARQDVPAILAEADIFVCSSRWEGHPLVCLEALAAGKAVVASEWGSAREALKDGETALIVDPRRPDQIGAVILQLLSDPGLLKQMGAKGRADVENRFSTKVFAHDLEVLYRELIELEPRKAGNNLALELAINMLTELGEVGRQCCDYEQRLQQLEHFMSQLKDNFLYRSARKVYSKLVRGGAERQGRDR